MLSWHTAITVQTCDEIAGFFKERGPKLVKAEVPQLNWGSSISGDLCCPQGFSGVMRVDWELLRAGAGYDQKGLRPLHLPVREGAEDQGRDSRTA